MSTHKAKQSNETKSVYTAFRCPPDILARAKATAKSERRSLSNFIVTLLDDYSSSAEAASK